MEPIPAELAELQGASGRKGANRMQVIGVILFATVCVSIGETLLSAGMKQVGAQGVGGVQMFVAAVSNPRVLGGTLLMMVYFGLYSLVLSWADISLVLPFTALSYLFVAILASAFLHEQVSATRWIGAFIITLGVMVVASGMKGQS